MTSVKRKVLLNIDMVGWDRKMRSVKRKVVARPCEVAENTIWHSSGYLFGIVSKYISWNLKPSIDIKQNLRDQIYDIS